MCFPKHFEQLLVGHLCWCISNQYHFGMPSETRAHLFIGRVWCVTTGVTHCSGIHARYFPKHSFRSPKTSQSKHGCFSSTWPRRHQRRIEYKVFFWNGHELVGSAWKCVRWFHHLCFLPAEVHKADARQGLCLLRHPPSFLVMEAP